MKIYVDFDETLVDSIDPVLLQLNRRFNTNHNMNDVVTWNFTNLFPSITSKEIEDIFESIEFFDNLKWKEGALNFINNHCEDIIIVTKGNENNLTMKSNFIRKWFPNIPIIGVPLHISKSIVDMSGGIFIDDAKKNLYESNAKFKILFRNVPMADWNCGWLGMEISSWIEIERIIDELCEFF